MGLSLTWGMYDFEAMAIFGLNFTNALNFASQKSFVTHLWALLLFQHFSFKAN